MKSKEMEYLKKENSTAKVIRTEILFTPILVFLPIFIGLLFIYDWYSRGVVENNPEYLGMLILGLIILIGNLVFDIPFIKSLRELTRKSNEK